MSEPKLISPMLDNFVMGDPISDRNGVRSCPAMDDITGKKYIVKIISSPASPTQLDAMLLSGAFSNRDEALAYYEDIAKGIMSEVKVLKKLADLEGFMNFDNHQFVPMDDGNGYDVYLLGTYKMSLAKFFKREAITHLQALNLGLDLCAALSTCRRLGYLYVNLKPENVYLTTDNGFRIGDLGFIKLDSLKFASLPDRYRSAYTAPELADPFAMLNETMDIYAAGAILYQAFSGGQLPTVNEDGTITPPDFADYEMAEIILKACDPNPENRWQDPAQMGHALVDYMQRNGAHDTPIVPPVLPEPEVAPVEEAEEVTDEEEVIVDETAEEEIPVEEELQEELEEVTEESEESEEAAEVTEEIIEEATEDIAEELEEELDETLPGMDEEDLDMEDVSEELSEIFSQADELLAHEIPEPVVAPEPIEVTLPEEIAAEEPTEEDSKQDEKEDDNAEGSESATEDDSDSDTEDEVNDEATDDEAPAKPKRVWLRITITLLVILGLLAGAFAFYKFYYMQTIDTITCEGEGTSLNVILETEADNSLLTVICTDTYGNKLSSAVVDGVATFQDLAPNSPYTISVEVAGFHGLDGETSTAYATPKIAIVKDFAAFTGSESGSVVLRFAVEGLDDVAWNVHYIADSGETEILECTDNMVTIPGLTTGKEYTFTLAPAEEVDYIGTTEIKHTVTHSIVAQDLYTSTVEDGKMTVYWSAPKSNKDTHWSVRCYNDASYDERIPSLNVMQATFENMTEAGEYVIEIVAEGMLAGQRTTVNTAATKITDIVVTEEDGATTLTWKCDGQVESNWNVEYTIDSNITYVETGDEECSITLPATIPGARYKFVIGNGTSEFIGNVIVHTAAEAKAFNKFEITSRDMALTLCELPDEDEWNIDSLNEDQLTDTFKVRGEAGVAITLNTSYERSYDDVTIQVVLRDEFNQIVAMKSDVMTWREMWSYGEGGIALPKLPGTAGKYTASVYIDGGLVGDQVLTVTE